RRGHRWSPAGWGSATPLRYPKRHRTRASSARPSECAPPNRAATRERTTVRAPRRDVGPRSVNSALGEPPPRLAVVMAVPLTLGRGHEARANGARTSCLLPPAARAPPGSSSRAALWPSFANEHPRMQRVDSRGFLSDLQNARWTSGATIDVVEDAIASSTTPIAMAYATIPASAPTNGAASFAPPIARSGA